MPLLGALLTNLFSGLVAWFAQYVTRKVAFGLAATAAMSTLTLGLYLLMRTSLNGLASYVTGAPAILLDALALSIPPAAPFVISTYITMWTACTVYTWQRDLLYLFAKAG